MRGSEELMEISGRLDASVLSPLEDTIMHLRQVWDDPAGKEFADRLEAHREELCAGREMIMDSVHRQS